MLAAHGPDGELDFIGSGGTGFTGRMLDDLLRQLQAIAIKTTPVAGRPVPREGLRPDKEPGEVAYA